MPDTSDLKTSQISGKKPDPRKATLSDSVNRWIRQAIPYLACFMIIGLLVWMAEPNSTFDSSKSAEGEYYNLLVQGFSEGHLYLKREAPAALAQLANPYDPIANAKYVADIGDISYYKGRLYLYFGAPPALVLFWPYHALTGDYLSEGSAVAILFGIGFVAFLGLARAICGRYSSKSYAWVLTGLVVILALTIGLTVSGGPYGVAIMGGFMFTMLALTAIWRAIHAKPEGRAVWLSLASLAYGLAVASRPSLLFGSIVLLIPVVQVWRESAERGSRWAFLSAAAALVPITLIGLGLMLYNDLRFGSPFEFGWRYQLNGKFDQTTAHQFGMSYFWFDFRTYFLHSVGLTRHLPFLRTAPIAPLPPGYDPGSTNAGGGILWRYPLVLLALAAPLAWRGRPAQTVSGLRWFATAPFFLFIISASTLCFFFAAGSGYELDFLPGLLLLSAIGYLALERVALPSRRVVLVLRWCGCLLLAYSLAFNVLSNVEAHAGNDCQDGNSSLHHNDPAEALAQYEDAESLWPDYPDAHLGLGDSLLQEGNMNDAIAEFQKVLELAPDNASAHGGLGHCLLETGSTNEAVAEYEKAVQLNPNSAGLRVGLADCFIRMRREDDAIAQIQKAVEIEPASAIGHALLGATFLGRGNFDRAIVEFQKTTELQPDSAHSYFLLGDAFSKKGTFDKAVAAYQKGIDLQPYTAQAYNSLGNAFREEGKATNAIASYRTAIGIDPQLMRAQVSLAWILATWSDASVRNGSEAAAMMTKANELSGNKDARILRTLAAAYAEAGQYTNAIATAQKACALASAQGDTNLLKRDEELLALFQTHQPYREVKSDPQNN